MTGWLVAAAVWILGMSAVRDGLNDTLKVEKLVWGDLDNHDRALYLAVMLFWPIAELVGLIGYAMGQIPPKDGE